MLSLQRQSNCIIASICRYSNGSEFRKSVQLASVFKKSNVQRHYSCSSLQSFDTERYWKSVLVKYKTVSGSSDKLQFRTSYYDFTPHNFQENKDPVIVSIHGVPGSSLDFHNLAEDMINNGARFISLDFPGFGKSSLKGRDIYRLDHSTEGKYDMLMNILEALDLTRVDVLLSHSAGTWLGFKACAESEMFKSAMFLNSLGARPHRTLRPNVWIQFTAALIRNPVLHPFFYKIMPSYYKIAGFKLIEDDYPGLPVAIETCAVNNFDQMAGCAQKMLQRKIPYVLASTENDKIVEWDIGREMAGYLGISDGEFIHYDKEKTPTFYDLLENDTGHFKRCLLFERGGHVIHKAHQQEIVKYILELVKRTAKHRL